MTVRVRTEFLWSLRNKNRNAKAKREPEAEPRKGRTFSRIFHSVKVQESELAEGPEIMQLAALVRRRARRRVN